MNPQQRQQHIREITRIKHINKNDIYKIQPDVWLVRSMTNSDVEYSVRKRDSTDNNNLDVSLYICTCVDFKKHQLACKHIFAVLAQLHIYDNNKENEYVDDNKEGESVNSETYDRNIELTKLQEDLTTIFDEWKVKKVQDICSLRDAFRQTAQAERARIARADIAPQVDERRIPQILSNTKFKRQINF
ncbi:hypothetical protein F8M41_005832 [Gigaspora margarita]|uniref:SWIM-type domain-containing protein n=1 Tax=Gigaspora margarita TaxID=4874 RepID=A0A8H4A5L7_GIGMA|nr:hypothetical protein F8M41_005832 [Gigaspora margarita]